MRERGREREREREREKYTLKPGYTKIAHDPHKNKNKKYLICDIPYMYTYVYTCIYTYM